MARARTSRRPNAAPSDIEAEDVPQHGPGPDADGSNPEGSAEPWGGRSMSKSAAARAAMAAGIESPQEASQFIRARYGIEMSPQHFSAVKSQMRKKDGDASRARATRRRVSAQVEGYLAPPPRSAASVGDQDVLIALEAIKPLVEQYGADRVKRMVELLG